MNTTLANIVSPLPPVIESPPVPTMFDTEYHLPLVVVVSIIKRLIDSFNRLFVLLKTDILTPTPVLLLPLYYSVLL